MGIFNDIGDGFEDFGENTKTGFEDLGDGFEGATGEN